jgi:outer membrane immunogenic protein
VLPITAYLTRRRPTACRCGRGRIYVNWTGCYIGGYIGGAFSERDTTFTDLGNNTFRAYSGGIVAGRAENPHSWDVGSNSSVIGGGTVGCNYQPMGSPLLVGIEGEAGYMKLEGSAFDPFRSPTVGAVTPDVLGTAKTGDWYGMVTARLGYSWGLVMTYGKGGVAFLQVQGSVVDACNNTGSGCGNWLIATTSSSDTFTAGTLGAGAEWAFAGNWSLKAEYMYIGLGDTHTITTCGVATTPAGATVGAERSASTTTSAACTLPRSASTTASGRSGKLSSLRVIIDG